MVPRLMLGVGLSALTIGFLLIAVPAGFIVGGLCLSAVALFVDGK